MTHVLAGVRRSDLQSLQRFHDEFAITVLEALWKWFLSPLAFAEEKKVKKAVKGTGGYTSDKARRSTRDESCFFLEGGGGERGGLGLDRRRSWRGGNACMWVAYVIAEVECGSRKANEGLFVVKRGELLLHIQREARQGRTKTLVEASPRRASLSKALCVF